ncbi:hypothetical protein FF38_06019, partial [Lucilia cuprina]
LLFSPSAVLSCENQGIILTTKSLAKESQSIYLIQGPQEFPKLVTPSSTSSPMEIDENLIYFDEYFALSWNPKFSVISAYDVRILRQSGYSKSSTALDNRNKEMDRVAIISYNCEWVQGDFKGSVFGQTTQTRVISCLDDGMQKLYTLYDDELVCRDGVLSAAPVRDAREQLYVRPQIEQAALVSLGFLYYNSGACHISDILIRELQTIQTESLESFSFYEGRCICQGIALGLINIGMKNLQSLIYLVNKFEDSASNLVGCINGSSIAILLSFAAVCAGSGNAHVLRVLRELWQISPQFQACVSNQTGFFENIALDLGCVSQSIGWLFLHGGQWSFKTDITSVTVFALFTFIGHFSGFNFGPEDFQHLRFLWVLSTEKRCIYSATNPSELVQAKLVFKDGSDKQIQFPYLLPGLESILHIEITDNNYTNVFIDPHDHRITTGTGIELQAKPEPATSLDATLVHKPDIRKARRQ